jgi:hypothetical protein
MDLVVIDSAIFPLEIVEELEQRVHPLTEEV